MGSTNKYYLCDVKKEQILAEFFDEEDSDHFITAMIDYNDRHGDDEGVSYHTIKATSSIQAQDILNVVAHAHTCKYAAFVMEAKRLDGDEKVQFADKWFKLMRLMNASHFWQQD